MSTAVESAAYEECKEGRDAPAVVDGNFAGSPKFVNELLSRRPSFRDGVRIRLADGEMWVFPAPPKPVESKSVLFGTEYMGLIQAIMEAEERSEQCLAELAFAIYLLKCNYSLTSADFEYLLGFSPESSESADSQVAFHLIAQEHLHAVLEAFPWRKRASLVRAWKSFPAPCLAANSRVTRLVVL